MNFKSKWSCFCSFESLLGIFRIAFIPPEKNTAAIQLEKEGKHFSSDIYRFAFLIWIIRFNWMTRSSSEKLLRHNWFWLRPTGFWLVVTRLIGPRCTMYFPSLKLVDGLGSWWSMEPFHSSRFDCGDRTEISIVIVFTRRGHLLDR